MWRRVSLRTIVHLALSLAVSIPILVDVQLRFQPTARHWMVLLALNLPIWCSRPRYRSPVIRHLTTTVTLLIAANLLLSPLIHALDPPAMTQAPHLHVRFRHVGEIRPALESVLEWTTDGRGHRVNGPIDYAKKPADVLRIVAIGASTTEQSDMDDRETWTWHVAEKLKTALDRKVEMINTAISGARGPQYYAALRSSEAYAPDVALFLLGINDWNAAIKAANRALPERVLRVVLPFSFFDSVLYNAIVIARGALAASRGQGRDSGRIWEDDGTYLSQQNNSLERARKVGLHSGGVDKEYAYWIGKIMSECKRRTMLCVFIEQPTAYAADIEPALRQRLWMTPMNEKYTLSLDDLHRTAATYNAFLADATRQAGFPFCATVPSFPPRLALFYDDCHFTTEGSRRLADIVGSCLLDLRDRLPR